MQKILVIGGLGFIGTNFINKLLKSEKYNIFNLDKISNPSNKELIYHSSKNYFFKKIDITNQKKLFEIILNFKPNLVINFAAETHVDNSIINPESFIKTNIIGTYNLLFCLKLFLEKNNNYQKKFRYIQISTDEVFGDLGRGNSNKSFSEKSIYNPSSPYSASKASADHLVNSWIRTYDFPAIITNISNNYGPYQFEEKFIPLCIKNLLLGKKIPIYGDGKQKRDWIYVEDNVEALIKILKNGKISSRYLIGTNSSITNIKLAKCIYKSLNYLQPNLFRNIEFKDTITFVKDRLGHDQKYRINYNKINTDLFWSPNTTLEVGLFKTCEWYIKNKDWKKKL